jgi:hypothetical protein
MSIALKYTTLKDASLPLSQLRLHAKKYSLMKLTAVILMIVLAVALPLYFLYALVGPQGYHPWSTPQANESAFLEEYASTPIPSPIMKDYLASR